MLTSRNAETLKAERGAESMEQGAQSKEQGGSNGRKASQR
jgi:hypothetical protein